jgi:hypothetical protein
MSQRHSADIPKYTLFDIQMGVPGSEFEKGIALYNAGKVLALVSDAIGLTATVKGTHMYRVSVNHNDFERGMCDCYLGKNNYHCKHMIAVAIAGVYKYRSDQAKAIDYPLDQAVCSGVVREITIDEITEVRIGIKQALRHIKSYDGPSRIWFAYQAKLEKGSRLMLYALSNIPVCKKSADICIDLIERLDEKLATGGIDDSNGVVGELIDQIRELLSMFCEEDVTLKDYIVAKFPTDTNFGWELHL